MKCPDPEAHELQRYYTYYELAALWRVSADTVHIWIRKAKVIGKGPSRAQFLTDGQGMGHAHNLIRADYARWLISPEAHDLLRGVSTRPANVEPVLKDHRARPRP